MVPMAYCTHKPPCERQKGMISVVSRPTSINPISALLDQPPFNSPATMAIFTQASRAASISAATYPTRAQLAAITHMQEQLAPILRVQNQLAGVSAATETLIGWTNSLRQAADPLQGIRSALSAIDGKQFQVFAKSIYGVQMAAAIQPALWYLEQEHPDVYREIVPDEPQRPAPGSSVRPQKNTPIRRRALDKAARMTGRTSYIIKSLDSKIQSMPSGKFSNLLGLLLSIGSIAPSEYAHSINLLCFVIAMFLTFYHKE